MISIMTLTNRYGGMDILLANLKRQTFADLELVLVDGLWREREDEVKDYFKDFRLTYVRQSDKREGAHTNLAHADNEGFRVCRGELIVCLQDYIWINPWGLEKFWLAYQANPKSLVTGVGDQYAKPSKADIVNEKGKITVFDKPYTVKPMVQCWADPRRNWDNGSFYMCYPQDIEMNYCSIPRKCIAELGGMDEQYDFEGFAWDNVYISQCADFLGYRPYIDQTNECMGFRHDDWWPNPLKVNRVSPADYHNMTMEKIRNGIRPIRLDYVKYEDM